LGCGLWAFFRITKSGQDPEVCKNQVPKFLRFCKLFTFNIAPTAGSGRIGFNYAGNDGGQNGTTSQFIAFDSVNFNGLNDGPPVVTPEPSSVLGLLTLGGFGLAASRRGKSKKVQA
jgi:PEP-CTERM motif